MAARLGKENVAEWTIGVEIGPTAPPRVPCTARVRSPRAGRGLGSRVMGVHVLRHISGGGFAAEPRSARFAAHHTAVARPRRMAFPRDERACDAGTDHHLHL